MIATTLTFAQHRRDEDDVEHQTQHPQGVTIELGGAAHLPTIIDVAARSIVARWSANSGQWEVKAPWASDGLTQRFDQVYFQSATAQLEERFASLEKPPPGIPIEGPDYVGGYLHGLRDIRKLLGLGEQKPWDTGS